MRLNTPRLACASVITAALLLCACSSGSGGGGDTTPPVTPAPTTTLTANPTMVTVGGSTTLTWTSTNATACTASGGWSGAKAASGSEQLTNVQASTTYSLACTGAGGTSAAVNAAVTASASATAHAGVSRTVVAGSMVHLSGEASFDPENAPLQYTWTQTSGAPTVTLAGANTANPTFTAPTVVANTALTFSLTVSDGATGASTPSTLVITVVPLAAGNVLVSGRVTYARVLLSPNTSVGLDYGNQVGRPARGITVLAASAGTATQLAVGETDSDGNYAISVPQNTPIDVYAFARLARDNTLPLPRWNIQVLDADTSTAPYSFTDGAFNSSTGVSRNLSIPSGFNSGGTVIGTRASAPFAVLDTIYQGLQTVLGVAPTANFAPLNVDWAANNPTATFFDSGAAVQTIVLSADITEDTEEFDQHVIAHEFGHYIEFNFSRADNIGGPHGIGDKLDIRVAFGEGFGYAFAAVVLKDPIVRDSLVRNGAQLSSTFSVETNPSQNPPGSPNGNFGCWCSESSVQSILWDLYDANADANDNLALGFKPLWDVLVSEQRTTPAMTSIFSFSAALKSAQSGNATSIDNLIAAQNITTAGLDAFGTTETFVPTPVQNAAALPIYTTITSGTQVTVLSVDDAGHYNKLGNRRFVRYNKTSSTQQTVTVTTSNTDPDVLVYRDGIAVLASRGPGNESFNITMPGTYVFDVYECANGCDTVQGIAGDYTITVAIN